jgi:hypothetical protein
VANDIGPFAGAALVMHGVGLAPVPCTTSDDGKAPIVKWKTWHYPPTEGTVRKWIGRFPDANVGIVTGWSNVTIVDIDDPDFVPDMMRRFGDTPLITETPSGGVHLWFKSAGERSANLRKRECLPVDIKAAGGFLVTPPSIRPSGPFSGCRYAFRSGSWGDIAGLPTLRPGSLPAVWNAVESAAPPERIPIGRRNNTLFQRLLRHAPGCDTFDDLLDVAKWQNESCDPQLSDVEVTKTAASVWRIQREGRNFVGRGRRVFVTEAEWTALAARPRGADALMLLTGLRTHNYDRTDFAASPKGMANGKLIAGWAHDRYRGALTLLTELGLLSIVHPGGIGSHDPRLFRFVEAPLRQKATDKGARGRGV